MTLQFKNSSELLDYLNVVEQRLKALELENHRLRSIAPPKIEVDTNLISQHVDNALPQTNLISPSFFKRAFTVWGHFFVAQLIIGVIFAICYFCLLATVFGSAFSNILKTLPR